MKTYYIKVSSLIEFLYERGDDQSQKRAVLELGYAAVESLKNGEPYEENYQDRLDNCGYLESWMIDNWDREEEGELGDDFEFDFDNAEFKILYPIESEAE